MNKIYVFLKSSIHYSLLYLLLITFTLHANIHSRQFYEKKPNNLFIMTATLKSTDSLEETILTCAEKTDKHVSGIWKKDDSVVVLLHSKPDPTHVFFIAYARELDKNWTCVNEMNYFYQGEMPSITFEANYQYAIHITHPYNNIREFYYFSLCKPISTLVTRIPSHFFKHCSLALNNISITMICPRHDQSHKNTGMQTSIWTWPIKNLTNTSACKKNFYYDYPQYQVELLIQIRDTFQYSDYKGANLRLQNLHNKNIIFQHDFQLNTNDLITQVIVDRQQQQHMNEATYKIYFKSHDNIVDSLAFKQQEEQILLLKKQGSIENSIASKYAPNPSLLESLRLTGYYEMTPKFLNDSSDRIIEEENPYKVISED
ncbi:MAG: hypothetical protein HAW62_04460 [Endozoicomonadaceae bacterium]|nr:hypothetical protein [Endozoicomonadaceae bacterium]